MGFFFNRQSCDLKKNVTSISVKHRENPEVMMTRDSDKRERSQWGKKYKTVLN